MNCDLYESYAEVNEALGLEESKQLSNDRNVEDPVLILGIRKWSSEGLGEAGPDMGFLGLTMTEHVRVFDKYDLFIYTR